MWKMDALRVLYYALISGTNQWVLKEVSCDDASKILSDHLMGKTCVARESERRTLSDTVIKAELKSYMETIQDSENIHLLYFVFFDLLYNYALGRRFLTLTICSLNL